MKLAYLAVISLLLTGCATFKTVGSFDDYNEVFYGTVNSRLIGGGGDFTMAGEKTKVKCTGAALPPRYYPSAVSCAGERGEIQGHCDDGRILSGIWYAESCTTGYVRGKDNEGNRFIMVFGMDEAGAKTEIKKQLARKQGKPDMPAHEPGGDDEEEGEGGGHKATGTGFVVSADGYLLTNYHVVRGSKKLSVRLRSGNVVKAKAVTLDASNDIALLKIQTSEKLTALPVGAAGDVAVGEDVMAYGFPVPDLEGQAAKATFGHVNALTGIRDDIRFMQIDVPIQPGNSGGPLVTAHGKVVGITTSSLSTVKAVEVTGAMLQNVNYALKIDYTLPMLSQAGIRTVDTSSQKALPFPEVVKRISASVALVIAE